MGARLGVLMTALLERLMQLAFALDDVMAAMDQVMRLMPSPHHLQMARYLDLLQNGEEDDSTEKAELAMDWFALMYRARSTMAMSLESSRETVQDYDEAVDKLVQALLQVADHFEYLALRHFYSAFSKGQYKSLRALIFGSELIRRASMLLVEVHMAGATQERTVDGTALVATDGQADVTAAHAGMAWYRDWIEVIEENWLLDFGERFDFYLFDEDSNVLLPQVVDMLYPDF